MKNKEPEKIELSDQDVDRLERELQASNLSPQTQILLITVLKWSRWVSMLLQLKTLNLKRLRRLIFGARTEKDASKDDQKNKDKKDRGPANTGAAPGDKKGKGRNTPDDFKGAKKILHEHESLSPGQECPECARGTLYQYKTSSFVTFIGQAPIQATRHDCQVLRCSACQRIFWPKAVDAQKRRKWDESVAATLAVMHYWMGVPFSRLERLQELGGMPLPKSTQWDLLEGMARPGLYIYQALKKYFADVKLVYNDDTPARILSVAAEVKGRPVKKKERRGTYTTAMVGVRDGHKVSLFMTGRKHAGENLKDLVEMRTEGRGRIMTMNDAASRAMPKDLFAEICNCLTHGRRNFYDLLEDCPREVGHVLKLLSYAYRADAQARKQGWGEDERLRYLKNKSGKAMRDLWRWCQKMLLRKKVEPNSGLGGAIRYMLKHWGRLTKFLTVPGAPLDNNVCERLVKVMIRYRKNSLFFKTENGALVGDVLMSLIQTCLESGVDAFHYLESILKNKALVKASPENWFPWNYTANLTESPA
jgi:transposase